MRVLFLSAALLTALAFAACGGDDDEAAQGASDPRSDAVQLVAADFQFAPTEFSFASGEKVQITLTNTGQAKHSFTVDELGVSQDVAANGEVTFDFTAPDHDVQFHCRFHPDTMHGTIKTGGGAAGGTSPSPTKAPSGGYSMY